MCIIANMENCLPFARLSQWSAQPDHLRLAEPAGVSNGSLFRVLPKDSLPIVCAPKSAVIPLFMARNSGFRSAVFASSV